MEKTLAGNGRRIVALGLACLLGWGLLKPTDARGATHYWDVNGDAGGTGGTGIWDTSAPNWSASSSGGSCYAWDNASFAGDKAYFGGTVGTVTVSGSIEVGDIQWVSDWYTITGGTLVFAGDATFTPAGNNDITIDSNISMPGSKLTFAGVNGPVLALGGTNDVGSFAMSPRGSLRANNKAAIGDVPIDLGNYGSLAVNIDADTIWINDFNSNIGGGLSQLMTNRTAEFSGDITGAGDVSFTANSISNAHVKLTRAAPYSGTGTKVYVSANATSSVRIAGANVLSDRVVEFGNGTRGRLFLDVDCTIAGLGGTPLSITAQGCVAPNSDGDKTLTIDTPAGIYAATSARLADNTTTIFLVKLGGGVQRFHPGGWSMAHDITGDISVGSGDTGGGYLVLADGNDPLVFASTAGAVTVGSDSGTGTGTLVGNATMAKATTVTANGTIIAGDLTQATDVLNNIVIAPPSDSWTVTVLKVDDPASEGYSVEFWINGVLDSTDSQIPAGASYDHSIQLTNGDTLDVYLTSSGAADYNLELYDESSALVDSSSELPAAEPDSVSGTYAADQTPNQFTFSGDLTIDGEYRCYIGAEDTAVGFSQILQAGAGTFAVGASSTFTVAFANGMNPDGGSVFWKQPRTWVVIDGSDVITGATFGTLNLGSYGAGKFLLGYDAGTFDITLDWVAGAVSVLPTVPIATEGSVDGVFTITRSAGSNPVDVLFDLSTNGAVIPGDFDTDRGLVIGNNTLTFPQDVMTIVIKIIPFMDGVDTGSWKEVYVEVKLTADYILGVPVTATVTIADDDGDPVLFLLESPDNNKTVPLLPDPVLRWGVSGAATWYELTLALDPSFTTLLLDREVVPTNSYPITTGLDYGGDYYWQVTAHNATGSIAAWNNDYHFTIAWVTPLVTIVKTLDAFEPSTNGEFTLTRVNGNPADVVIVSYQITGGAMAGTQDVNYVALPGTVTFQSGDLTATIFVEPMVDGDQLDQTVTVLLSDAAGGEYVLGTPKNATLTLFDAEAKPRSFDLTSPGSMAGTTGVLLDPTPVLRWEEAQGATSYFVELDEDPGVGSPFFSAQTTGTSYTLPPFTVRGLTTYYWMVTASNANPGDTKANDEFIFETEEDFVLPLVKSTTPGGGDDDVPVGTNVKIVFSEPMDPVTTEAVGVVSMKDEYGTDWPGVASLSGRDMTLTFNPDVDLTEGVTYTVTVAATAEDLRGNTLDGDENGTEEFSPADDYTFKFKAEPPLVGLAVGAGCLPGAGSAPALAMLGAALALVLAALAGRSRAYAG